MSPERKTKPAPDSGRGPDAETEPDRTSKPKRSRRRRILRWALLAVLALFLLGCAAFAVGYFTTDIPDPNEDFQAQTTFVYYADGKTELGRFATQDRQSIPLDDVPACGSEASAPHSRTAAELNSAE